MSRRRLPALPRGARGVLVAAVVVPLLLAVVTLIAGRHTLYLRDVLTTHLPMKAAQAAAWRSGELPVFDLQRGGGQPLLGNPNGLPFYPDNLLFLVAPPLWATNAHFWLHLLLAPWCAAWLGRRLGMPRGAAWAGGAVYALSGFFLAQLSYYNLVGGATLAPALVAACLAARDERQRWRAPVVAALWALLLLAGDPTYAALALFAAATALWLVPPRSATAVRRGDAERGDESTSAPLAAPPRRRWLGLALALALGTALAAPQLVELWRALPASTRAVAGFDLAARTVGSWDPRQALELVLPFPFGRVDRVGEGGFWGHRFHPGGLPFFLALHPGLLALALAAVGGVSGRHGGRRWALLSCGLGLFVALGRFNPLLAPVLALPGAELLRFPLKAWLLVALGVAVLAAAGWQRAVAAGAEPRARRHLRRLLAGAAAGYLVLAAATLAGSGWIATRLPRLVAREAPAVVLVGQPERWAASAFALAAVAAGLAGAVRWARTRPRLAGPLLLAMYAGSQLLLLAPGALARDEAARYTRPPAFATLLPAGTRLAHGSIGRRFARGELRPPADGSARWLARQGAAAGYPLAGVPRGWRYELAVAPEGLDGFLTRLAADAMVVVDDPARVRLLRAWGVEVLLLERALSAEGMEAGAALAAKTAGPLAEVFVYRLADTPPPVRLVLGARPARDPREALAALLDPRFDPRREVVLADRQAGWGGSEPRPPGAGVVRVARDAGERLVVDISVPRGGWLVVERTWQPQWQASVDGRPRRPAVANLHRLAVPVPAGEHRVELWVDRRPLQGALLAAAIAAFGLLALTLKSRPG